MMRHILDLAVVLLHAMLLQRLNVKVPFLEKKKCSNSGAYINNICKKNIDSSDVIDQKILFE